MQRRALMLTTLLTLSGCAAMQTLSVDVSSFGEWPAARGPGARGSYAFERLPSQQQRAEQQQALETAAAAALAQAGFTPVAAGAEPDLVIQLGARVDYAERSPWDDPLWWHGGFGRWRYNPWRGPYWNGYGGVILQREPARYDREVALLIRERASGKPLYEARASSTGFGSSTAGLAEPMLRAALADFPAVQPTPRSVRVPLTATP
ncbi:MAG: DUF4136 domain-containing protein [Burkholderiaceae bacterium]|nr:DUF4136 domain-containing protein [Burkholderiaceae bacterium]